MRGRLVQASPDQVTRRAHQGQLGLIRVRSRREGPQQRLDGLLLPVERQAERMVGEQPGRAGPVARRLRMPDGVSNPAMLGEPPGGPPVQRRHFLGPCPAHLQPQQIPEQVVIAKPRPLGVQRHDKRARIFEFQQDPFRTRAPGQQVRQLTVDPIEQRGAQQQLPDLIWLALQHLGDQVLGDRAIVSGEVRDEPLGVGVIGQRDRREPQARGPPFRPLVQPRRSGLRQRDTRGVEKLAGLLPGEAQISRADLGQLACQAQPVQPQPQVPARGRRRLSGSCAGAVQFAPLRSARQVR